MRVRSLASLAWPLRRSPSAIRHRDRCTAAASLKASLKASLNLPKTSFPLQSAPTVVEPQLVSLLSIENYKRQAAERAEQPPFVLHDGPPYANGDLHMGHFLNKVLKDVVNRWQLLNGRRVHFVPGWDCHGLPIELKALQTSGADAAHQLPALELRACAAACATDAISSQREAFLRWGIMADWEAPYYTMQPAYEAAQLGVLRAMLRRGLIFRGARPVHWSPASRTALAEAELEYEEAHISTAAYVRFGLRADEGAAEGASGGSLPPAVLEALGAMGSQRAAMPVGALVWTTTPWTIPANQAICVNGGLPYVLVEVTLERRPGGSGVGDALTEVDGAKVGGLEADGAVRQLLVLAEARVEHVAAELGARSVELVARLSAEEVCTLEWAHPLSGRRVPTIAGTHVSDETGTGLVHTAPGHGAEDYQVGVAHGLPIASPVDERGRFTDGTDEAAPFAGLPVLGEGNTAVLTALDARGALLHASAYTHRYPYDWRSKTPVIFRTTPQWFADLSGLRADALDALEAVQLVPPAGRTRLEAFVRSRAEWCLSRQRSWGVPLPAFYDAATDAPVLTEEIVAHVEGLVAAHGADCWWAMSVEELLPPSLRANAAQYRKGTDTLDVWFDSGCSWAAVTPPRGKPGEGDGAESVGVPSRADVYLEGSDQHRGWFQSSLLTHVGAMGGGAPYGAIVTHGFVVDERGAKMSKSIGNVLTPAQLIDGSPSSREQTEASVAGGETADAGAADWEGGAAAGARGHRKMTKAERKAYREASASKAAPCGVDVLRLWVAMADWKGDVAVGSTVLQKTREAYRRLRNSCRFMLANLSDFDREADAVPLEAMRQIDRYMLHRLGEYLEQARASYDAYATARVVSGAVSLAADELSAEYFSAVKDRLYCETADSTSRRAVQTVLDATQTHFLLSVAPVLPFLAEEVHRCRNAELHAHRRTPPPATPPSLFSQVWSGPANGWLQPELARHWAIALATKAEVNKVLHAAQAAKRIPSTAAALVALEVEPASQLYLALQAVGEEMNDLLLVAGSRLEFAALGNAGSIADGGAAGLVDADGHPLEEVGRATSLVPGHVFEDGVAQQLGVLVYATTAPKCARCWRHVFPDAPVNEGTPTLLTDGWQLRGHAGPCAKHLDAIL